MLARLLYGTKVQLNAVTASDLPAIARWSQDTVFQRLFDGRPAAPQTEASLARWLEDEQKSSTAFPFAVRLIGSDEIIGLVELEGIFWSHQVCFLSIGIGETAKQGMGYGREAMQLALAFAFNELNLHRVQLTVFSYNERAIALYEKLGFQREGVFREALYRDGKRYDMYLYGLLRHEWDLCVKAER